MRELRCCFHIALKFCRLCSYTSYSYLAGDPGQEEGSGVPVPGRSADALHLEGPGHRHPGGRPHHIPRGLRVPGTYLPTTTA